MTVVMTNAKDVIEVFRPERRRRWTAEEKLTLVRQTLMPGQSVSVVAREHGINASQLFGWRKRYQEGGFTSMAVGEDVVAASDLAEALRQVKQLQRLLGKKTMENEILREALELDCRKKWSARSPSLREDGR